ncbi:PaaI family thioesterase [Nocardia sp. alder85J]|uniref:PaaI family thioesterase n=1 Tax=Nocardia sp. alder85J TaxID=2862949 RepID=UPI001CD4AF18|nr:PaaI family thioesterase [Nocardia sp. alder85J]MCX4091197.1 PaaI family thioesterase [Nocardia sp. alder85J]
MTENPADALPSREHHEGGFRPMPGLDRHDLVGDLRGGPHFGEYIEQVRGLMDRVRLSCPSDEAALAAIARLKELNDLLDDTVVDEWSVPGWVRRDLPANGNITLPPFVIDHADRDNVEARITFRTSHLGGNAAAHGGHIGVAFDSLLGTIASLYGESPTRTASLTIDYRSITPLNKELTARAWTDRREGRKIYVLGTLYDGDRLCAEANGLFLTLKPGQQ